MYIKVEVYSISYPGMSKSVVTRIHCDILLSEIHNKSIFAVSRLRRIFRSPICQEGKDIY